MSSLTQFTPKFPVGAQRFYINSTQAPAGYLPCDGSIVSQSTYPELFAQVGLIIDGNSVATWNTVTASGTGFGGIATNVAGQTIRFYGGSNGRIYYGTPTSSSWTTRSTGATGTISGVVYTGSLYGVVDNNGYVYTSTNIVNWTLRYSGTNAYGNAFSYVNNLYIISGNNSIITSTNAANWTTRTTSGFAALGGFTYGNGIYLAGGVPSGSLITSTDAINWTTRSIGAVSYIYGTCYNSADGTYAAIDSGLRGRLFTSTNAVNWVLKRTTGTAGFTNIVYGAGVYVLGGGTSAVYSSTDLTNWAAAGATGELSYYDNVFLSVSYATSTLLINRYASSYSYAYATNFKLPDTNFLVTQAEQYTVQSYIKAT